MIVLIWTKITLWIDGDIFFFLAMFCAMSIGIMMQTGHLKDNGVESEEA
jgi:hypothetical protein